MTLTDIFLIPKQHLGLVNDLRIINGVFDIDAKAFDVYSFRMNTEKLRVTLHNVGLNAQLILLRNPYKMARMGCGEVIALSESNASNDQTLTVFGLETEIYYLQIQRLGLKQSRFYQLTLIAT